MPAKTEWISQPAISSASSTARWMDWTVESMLTTTPFFRPRDGCEPTPTTSMVPSGPSSPTIATTFEVPMSRPTIRLRSDFLGIGCRILLRGDGDCGTRVPADAESIGVAHVHVLDLREPLGHQRAREVDESFETVGDGLSPQLHDHAVRQLDLPCAALVEPHAGEAQARLGKEPLRVEIELGDDALAALWPLQQRQLRRHVAGVADEELAARVEQPGFVPARRGHLLGDRDADGVGPAALHDGTVHPVDAFDAVADAIEVHGGEPAFHDLDDRALDLRRRDTLECSLEEYAPHGTVERHQQQPGDNHTTNDDARRRGQRAPVQPLEGTRIP